MVFGCISKNFPENIFWCLEKKKENTNPEKHKPQPRKKSSTTTLNTVRRPRHRSRSEIAIDGTIAISQKRDRDRRQDRDLREFALSIAISILREIAINGVARSRTGDRDQRRRGIADWRSRTRTGDLDQRRQDRRLEIAISRARALSLSLIFRKHFEGKIEV